MTKPTKTGIDRVRRGSGDALAQPGWSLLRRLAPGLTVVFVLFMIPTAGAALITSGTYDESTTQTNAVDWEAAGNTVTLAEFKVLVGDAYGNDRGGVIHFDDQADGTVLADGDADEPNPDDGVHEAPGIPDGESFEAGYGTGGSRTLRVGMGQLTERPDKPSKSPDIWEGQWSVHDTSESDRNAVSDQNAMSGVTDWHLEFSRPLEAVGITALSRNASEGRDVTVELFYDDSTRAVMVTDEEISIGDGFDDTFFGYVAPENKLITGMYLDVDYSGGGREGDPGFTSLDDLGFVVPEPGSFALLILACVACLVPRPLRIFRTTDGGKKS